MSPAKDPTLPLRKKAGSFPDVSEGTSCNQTSFKSGKNAFLYVGPGPKGKGFKAMFKLGASVPEARELAAEQPECFQVGTTAWVTTRFTCEDPLPKSIWGKWLAESYEISGGRIPGST